MVVWCAMCVLCLVKADWHELQTVAPLALFWLGEKAHSNYEIFCCSICICSMFLFVVFVQEKNDFRFPNESFCDLISISII